MPIDGDRRRGGLSSSAASGSMAAAPRRQAGDFPACACDALHQVGKALRQQNTKSRSNLMSQNLLDLQATLDQDLFCLGPDRRTTRLSPIQQLKLLELLCSFFQEKCEEGRQRYAFFELIFCGREGETVLHEARIGLLVKLCSLAVQYPCHSLLVDVSLWLNKIGLVKPYASQVVATVVEHFCKQPLTSGNSQEEALYSWLYPVATTAPEFAAFVVVLPLRDSRDPPIALIAVVAEWLCSASKPIASTLLRGELNKVFLAESFPNIIRIACSSSPNENSSPLVDDIICKFHTGLLHFILAWADVGANVKLLNDTTIITVMESIASSGADSQMETTKIGLDRLAQLLQIAVACKCFNGSLDSIKHSYQSLGISHDLFSFIFTTPTA
uniref:Uncharacterized protein n=1 Tax=Plectus sambesii TaxID=2011161 RepID=A0A914XRH1_9BILA